MRTLLIAALAAFGVSFSAPAFAEDGFFTPKSAGNWMLRLRSITVVPNDGDDLNAPSLDTSIDTSTVGELDITYFFTPNVAVELIAAVTPHEVSAKSDAGTVDLGEVWLLPPTLTLQYHVTQLDGISPFLGRFKPYVGAGVNYTMFFNGESGDLSIDYDDSFGFALQAGLDVEVSEGIYLNVDVKRLFLETNVDVAGGAITGDVDIDPWIFGAGIGYRF